MTLDMAGLLPGVGEAFDGINAILYLTQGDKVNAGLSAMSMIPVIGSVGTAAKVAKTVSKPAEKITTGITSAGKATSLKNVVSKPLYRAMSEGELKAVKETGYLRGGIQGKTYFTDSYYKGASKVQDRLSLPSKPSYIMEFEIKNNLNILGGNTVRPDFGGFGGGREYFALSPIKVKIINYQKLR